MRRPWPVERRVLACGTTRPHLGATRPRVGIANLGFEPPSWQCILFIILYLLVKASSLDKQMPTRGRVAPRLGRVPPAGEDASPLAGEYENSSHLLVIPLVLTLFNTPPNLIYFCFILLHDNKCLCVNNQRTNAFFANQTKY